MSFKTEIRRSRGDDVPFVFFVTDKAGAAIDVSANTFILSASSEKDPETSNNVFQLTGAVTETNKISFPITPVEADLVGNYHYDIEMTDGAGKKKTLVKDVIEFVQDITK